MKHLHTLSFLLLFYSLQGFSQFGAAPTLQFAYDQSGNQVLRCRYGCFRRPANNTESENEKNKITEQTENQFKYFPNPVTDELTLNWTINKITSIYVFDMNSKLLNNFEVKNSKNNSYKIPFTNYIQGVYIVKVLFEDQSVKMFKIIKK